MQSKTTALGNITGLPWKAEGLQNDASCLIVKSEDNPQTAWSRIALVYDHHTTATAYPTACLMAAAPELLEACEALPLDQSFVDAADFKDNAAAFIRAMELARIAIAKATGGVA